MTTLVLAAFPATGSNRLTITPTADITGIRRTDANGTHDVRTLDGLLPWETTDVLTLDDYEAGHGTSTYTVTTAAGTVYGAIVLTLASPWLVTPEVPQFSAAVPSVLDYGAGMTTLSTVHEPEGREDTIVIVRGASSRRGTMQVQGGTYAQALNLLRLFQRGQTMQLRQLQHAGMDMYFLPMAADIVTTQKAGALSVFDVNVNYTEVARPAGALAGALGWTWAELELAFTSWGAVSDAYASWGDLRIDRRKP